LSEDDAFRIVGRMVGDQSTEIATTAARRARSLGPRAAAFVPDLLRLLDEDGTHYHGNDLHSMRTIPWNWEAVLALESIGPAASESLFKLRDIMLSDEHEWVRAAAVTAIAKIDPDFARRETIVAVLDKSDLVKRVAIMSLSDLRVRSDEVMALDIKALESADPLVRIAAADALGVFRRASRPCDSEARRHGARR
jgi:HEAT repeat protein